MAQDDSLGIATKAQGDPFTHTECNTIVTGIEGNATDAESRLTALEATSGAGWTYHKDGLSSPASYSLTTTPQQISIDGLGQEEIGYLPSGVGSFWDKTNDWIMPDAVGNTFTGRLDLVVTAKGGGASEIDVAIDIGSTPDGSGGAGSIVIFNAAASVAKTIGSGYIVTFPLDLFCLSTFLANGGTIWASTDTGTATVTDRSIFLNRIYGA